MAEVYWIRLPEHTDMFSQGYIGVTRNPLQRRFNEHIKKATLGHNGLFSRAIRKYKEKLIISTVLIGSEEYCYEVEERLRPSSYIGWNTARGGMRSDWEAFQSKSFKREVWIEKLRQANLGKKMPEDFCNRQSEISKEAWQRAEFVERMREIKDERRVVKPPSRLRFWSKSGKSLLIHRADEIYNIYTENPSIYCREIAEKLGLKGQKYVRSITKLTQKFFSGWNPHEDIWWQVDFNGLPENQVPNYLYFDPIWNMYDLDICVWTKADEAYSMWVSHNASISDVSKSLGLSASNLQAVFTRFNKGWKPLEDPRWVKWRDEQLSLISETHKETPEWQNIH